MQIKRAVAVVAIVTEQFKQQMIAEFEEGIKQVDASIQALESQSRRYLLQLQTADLAQANAFRRQVDAEKQKQEGTKQELQARLQASQELTIGSEVERGNVESYVEMQVGDNLIAKLTGAAIVVKDDVVVEIRG
ncbi:MAG TPA: YlqD family protein [Armatimonadota bacterium]